MQKWEYLVLISYGDLSKEDARLHILNGKSFGKDHELFYPYIKELGEQGWELVSVHDNEYYFKRPKEISN